MPTEQALPQTACDNAGEGAETLKELNIVESKKLRVQIDECIQNLKKSELNRRSRERSLSITKLQEAVMWLGMDLKDIGGVRPYPNGF